MELTRVKGCSYQTNFNRFFNFNDPWVLAATPVKGQGITMLMWSASDVLSNVFMLYKHEANIS